MRPLRRYADSGATLGLYFLLQAFIIYAVIKLDLLRNPVLLALFLAALVGQALLLLQVHLDTLACARLAHTPFVLPFLGGCRPPGSSWALLFWTALAYNLGNALFHANEFRQDLNQTGEGS